MIFSSTIFLFGFLPWVLLFYFIVPIRWKNTLLLVASLFFYAWGELGYTLLMVVSILWNYCMGRLIDGDGHRRGMFLFLGIGVNLLLLGYFKYWNFILENVNRVLAVTSLHPLEVKAVHLPLGISFFTFQAISYLIDVYRRETTCQKNPLTMGLYIAMFPQLIAGPIVRYGTVAKQLVNRTITLGMAERGIVRFVYGLSKKLLIANPLGEVADALFALPGDQLAAIPAWVALVAYSLQIYFDFSGYSDMAIGLGLMLGFTFPENFNYPYAAKSIRDFWRRWHMSLTNWLRDYLYIPLGGNRVASWRITFNLLFVFLLCGLWHGASWNFVIWGCWHGCFLIAERGYCGRILAIAPSPLRHLYVLGVVAIGWVFFRAENLSQALSILQALSGMQGMTSSLHPLQLYLSGEAMAACGVGLLLSMPVFTRIGSWLDHGFNGFILRFSLMCLLLYGSFMKISSGTYNPFLYFRF